MISKIIKLFTNIKDLLFSKAKYFVYFALVVIFINACLSLYILRKNIFDKTHKFVADVSAFVNPTKEIGRPLRGNSYTDIRISDNSDKIGMWTAAFDWPVMSLHAALLPDGTVLTFGSYSIIEKEKNKKLSENKKIKLSNNNYNHGKHAYFKLNRDDGDYQYGDHHPVNGGVDFDIWDPSLGLEDKSHHTFIRPIVHDAFCSVVRVLDDENVLILGGNTEPAANSENTKKKSTIYNIKKKKFIPIADLSYERWYGSIAKLSNNSFVMFGGIGAEPSTIPEILEKDINGNFRWRQLKSARSDDLFGNRSKNSHAGEYVELKNHEEKNLNINNQKDEVAKGDEWYYPKAYTVSDGSIVGISYDKLWRLDPTGDGNVIKTGNIPLKPSTEKNIILRDQKKDEKKSILISGERGAGVGFSSSSVMIEKDKVFTFGGQQVDFLPSSDINLIDFSNSFRPKVKKISQMQYPRMNGNVVLLPNGNVFIHGGTSFKDREFSVLNPEIFSPKTFQTEIIENPGQFRRNYHSSLLLLPDATILVSGGDVWNSEIYYPSYLFEKKDNQTVFAKRPEIVKMNKKISNRSGIDILVNDSDELSKISLISTGSTTHAQASELKYFDLKFKKISKNNIKLDIEKNKNIIQDGTYLLFLIDKKGTPSLGKILTLS